MKQLLELLQQMIQEGLIGNYALGGATALIRYFEPIQTQDIDVFIVLSNEKNGLVNLSPIYAFLKSRKVEVKGEYFFIDTTPVQFLVPYNDLVEEAVRDAETSKFMGVEVRVPSVEHLMAIMVQTSRIKDKARLAEIFTKPTLFDSKKFESIIEAHGLGTKLENIRKWISG